MTENPSAPDWEEFGRALAPSPSAALWRTFCDALNAGWLRGHLADRRWTAALKTDAFDEAVGAGVHTLLREAADSACWMDTSQSVCRLAALRFPRLTAVACDVRRLPFRAGAFDLVVSLSTLDHFTSLDELRAALDCIHRVMKPGGCLLITLDNLENPLVRLRNAIPWRLLTRVGLVPYPVGVTAGATALRVLLQSAGFEVRQTSTLMHVPRAPAVAVAAVLGRLSAQLGWGLFRRACTSFEVLGELPTARWTANYVAVAAVKPLHWGGVSTLRS